MNALEIITDVRALSDKLKENDPNLSLIFEAMKNFASDIGHWVCPLGVLEFITILD